ncbi:MAG: 2-C-methyl-D-erythritol 4-phosphate cytidylyltransferase [Actinomycetota bacterium]
MEPDTTRGGVWTIVVGGGSGARFGRPKQYEQLTDTERVIDRSRRVAATVTDGVVVVVPPADAAAEGGVPGGATRSDSVRAGLSALPDDGSIEIVCVHDAARPMATHQLYRRVIDAVRAGADAAVPGVTVADTIKLVDDAGRVVHTPDRGALRAIQTPQAFRLATLRAAHADGGDATDDAALVESAGGVVVVVDGESDNQKITLPADLERARALCATDLPGGPASAQRRSSTVVEA